MRRLTSGKRRERGAVAVIMAFAMITLMAFAGLAIDLGGAYSDRQQLQNGADAAAIAIARSCQKGACVNTADAYVKANKLDGVATGRVVGSMTSPVTVEATYTRTNWFGAVMGRATTQISTRAAARWGYVSGGVTFPLTFSWCAFYQATGGWDDQGKALSNAVVVINMIEHTCTPPAHNEVAGGFGWLSGVNCSATVLAGDWVMSDPGNDGSGTCKDFDWTVLRNKTVQVPIFEEVSGTGSNAKYRIKGLAAFTVTGYCFSNDAKWNLDKCPSERRVQGHFSNYHDGTGGYAIDPNAAHFGFDTVELTA
ncbi:MAG TPA: Tad domain-containing protein [Propionicimonas sp.]|uniref:Tad domain-containing protein n=1 Tax=Propionicimonas sp. TaxID=1955623 RepID=UPI002F421EF9